MNINIKTTNIELTDSIRDYVFKRLEGLDRLIDSHGNEVTAHVEVGKISNHHKSGDIFKAEIHIGAYKIYAVSEKEDLYAAIDEVRDLAAAEAKKQKDKKVSLIRRSGQKAKSVVRGLFNRS